MNRRVQTWYVDPKYGPRVWVWVWHGPQLVYCGPLDKFIVARKGKK